MNRAFMITKICSNVLVKPHVHLVAGDFSRPFSCIGVVRAWLF